MIPEKVDVTISFQLKKQMKEKGKTRCHYFAVQEGGEDYPITFELSILDGVNKGIIDSVITDEVRRSIFGVLTEVLYKDS